MWSRETGGVKRHTRTVTRMLASADVPTANGADVNDEAAFRRLRGWRGGTGGASEAHWWLAVDMEC